MDRGDGDEAARRYGFAYNSLKVLRVAANMTVAEVAERAENGSPGRTREG